MKINDFIKGIKTFKEDVIVHIDLNNVNIDMFNILING
jgi:hypothetical protein